jgi:hypothetical protein
MAVIYRRTFPLYLSIIVAFIVVLRSFFKIGFVTDIASTLLNWGSIVIAFAVGLGYINLILYHVDKIRKFSNEPIKYQWFYSITTVGTLLLFTILGLLLGTRSSGYLYVFTTVYRPVASISTMVSGFFAISAMYRAFRIRNLEAFALIFPALLMLLMDAPVGGLLVPGGGALAQYLLKYIGSAAFRGFVLAASIGVLIVSIRTIFGLERGYLPEEV